MFKQIKKVTEFTMTFHFEHIFSKDIPSKDSKKIFQYGNGPIYIIGMSEFRNHRVCFETGNTTIYGESCSIVTRSKFLYAPSTIILLPVNQEDALWFLDDKISFRDLYNKFEKSKEPNERCKVYGIKLEKKVIARSSYVMKGDVKYVNM